MPPIVLSHTLGCQRRIIESFPAAFIRPSFLFTPRGRLDVTFRKLRRCTRRRERPRPRPRCRRRARFPSRCVFFCFFFSDPLTRGRGGAFETPWVESAGCVARASERARVGERAFALRAGAGDGDDRGMDGTMDVKHFVSFRRWRRPRRRRASGSSGARDRGRGREAQNPAWRGWDGGWVRGRARGIE